MMGGEGAQTFGSPEHGPRFAAGKEILLQTASLLCSPARSGKVGTAILDRKGDDGFARCLWAQGQMGRGRGEDKFDIRNQAKREFHSRCVTLWSLLGPKLGYIFRRAVLAAGGY